MLHQATQTADACVCPTDTDTVGAITIFHAGHPIGKEFSLSDGVLKKRTLGALAFGEFETREFRDATEFADLIQNLSPLEAISASLHRGGAVGGDFTSRKNASPGSVCRTKEFFGFSKAPGVLTIDYDPDGAAVLEPDSLWHAITGVVPGLEAAGTVQWVSGSSYIHNGETCLQALRGQRIYILVSDAADVPRAMKVLQQRLWLAGYGRILVSSSGSLLERTLADESLGQPDRLDYIGGAVLRDGLSQRRPAPLVRGGVEWLDTTKALPDLSAADEAKCASVIAAAKRAAQPEADMKRAAWCDERARHFATQNPTEYAEAYNVGISTARAALSGVLLGDFSITLEGGEHVTVSQILTDREKYHHRLTLDPLEPEYREGHVAGKLFLYGAVPNLFSFAHGGTSYRLSPALERVVLQPGRSALTAVELLERLGKTGCFFNKGGLPVSVGGGVKNLANVPALAFEIGTRFATFRPTKEGDVPADVPDAVMKMVIAGASERLPPLKHVVDHPFATATEVVTRTGYHDATGVFAEFDPSDYDVPLNPSRGDVVNALRTLWTPFERFAFDSDRDRGALLSAILGIVVRPSISTAPGVLIDAPCPGSGKTLLAQTLGALATGREPEVKTFAGEADVELQKTLTSLSMNGAEVFIWDNVVGHMNSAVLAGFLTSGAIVDRVLGGNTTYSGTGPRHVFLTSNNAMLGQDLAARFVRIRIDHKTENPSKLRFNFNPIERALSGREAILTAALTVVRSFQRAGMPNETMFGYRMGDWDRLVRSCVVWLGSEGFLADAGVASRGMDVDPISRLNESLNEVGSGEEATGLWLEALKPLGEFSVGSLLQLLNAVRENGSASSLLASTLDVCNGKPLVRGVVRTALEARVGRIVYGLRLTKRLDKSNVMTYSVA